MAPSPSRTHGRAPAPTTGWPWWRVVALWRLEGERFVDRFHKLPAVQP